MKYPCLIGGHSAPLTETYNAGFFFGRCGDCGVDLIRTGGGDWRAVPGGHLVVWKSGRHSHSLAPDYSGVLPVAVTRAQLPATRTGFASWSRDLMCRATSRKRRAAAAASRDEQEERPYPALVVLTLLLGAALPMLFGVRRSAS